MSRSVDTCDCCGGEQPAPSGRELDALDRYLVRRDGMCTGELRTDGAGTVLGCGAWKMEAYQPDPDADSPDEQRGDHMRDQAKDRGL